MARVRKSPTRPSSKAPSRASAGASPQAERIAKAVRLTEASANPPRTTPVFDAESVETQRRLRFNPLRSVNPDILSQALDQFDLGILRPAALLWDAMCRRDDTLSFVKPQLENSIAAKPWGVFKKKDADPREAARHAAALEYFYDNLTCLSAFDRNQRGGRHRLLKQMGEAASYLYSIHHFVWEPQPGRMIQVDDAAPVPALKATMEHVPLWFFENVSGTLRFLPFGGFGTHGQELNWEGEWMVTTGAGIMFAASICYMFKRLTFQDWTIFNERYAQNKVVGLTSENKESPQGKALADIVANFNGDMGIVLYGQQNTADLPIQLLGPQGAATVDIFERFLERQDRKLTVMYRGSDLRNMSRERDVSGVSAQSEETEALEIAHCANIADACRTYIDRNVIRFCFGEGVEPLAWFGLPDMEREDAKTLRENAGFLADRGLMVDATVVADRLGVTLTEDPAEALGAEGADLTDRSDLTDQSDPDESEAEARLQELVKEATANGGPGSGRYPKGSGRGRIRDAFGKRIDESQGGLSVQENIRRGVKCLDYATRHKTDVPDAMYRKEVGRIDFAWGTPGESSKDFQGGSGLSHILAKHGEEDLKRLPVVLAKGKITQHAEAGKRLVQYGNYTASLVKEKSRSAWVLTGFSTNRRQVAR